MAVDLGLCPCERPLALARSHQQKTNARSMLVHQRCRFEQRWDPLLPSHARDRDDDLGRAQTERLAELGGGGPRPSSLFAPLDIDAGAGYHHIASPADHPVAHEEGPIVTVLE